MKILNDSETYLPLEKLESEHCALIIDRALGTIDEITSHKVELNNHRAFISSNDLVTAIPLTVTKIRELGYNVSTVKSSAPVLNMTCAACAINSQRILQMQLGVVSAAVNYATNTATIEFIPTITNLEKLKTALQSIGYDLLIDEKSSSVNALEEIKKNNFNRLKLKTLGALLLTIPIVLIAMIPKLMVWEHANITMWILSSPVLFIFGAQFFIGAYKQLKHRSANMDTLVALSTSVAYTYSVFNTLFPEYWHSRGLHAHVYFEAAAVVITFILLGKLLEEKAKTKTSTALSKLIGLQPKKVTIITDKNEYVEIDIESVKINDILLVKPGEKIAVDGIVTVGNSFVNESMLSGEPIPLEKNTNDKVFAGTINQNGSFQFKATKVGNETFLAHIIKMIQDAQGSKAPVQKLVDKISGIFVPIVIIISLLSFGTWFLLGGENGFTQGLIAMVTVLVIACPCALGLATPTAIMVGIGKGAEHGILIKDAESLEAIKNVDVIILDKTGTITEGKPSVKEIKWFTEIDQLEKDILFSIENISNHPLAESIVKFLKNDSKIISNIQVENVVGKGIHAKHNGDNYYLGSSRLLKEKGISLGKIDQEWIENAKQKAQTIVLFSNDKKLIAGISIEDKLKESSITAIHEFQKMGIETIMLTGDNESTAAAIAKQIGITNYKSEVLPNEKYDFVKELQKQGKKVAMVGDGINDSAALAQANVSIAMGQGSDIAIDVAKMTIISNDLTKISRAITISKQTVATIKQNLFWAFAYNVIGIPIAAGILFPINGFLLNPMIAGAAMALSSVSVVTNSLILKLKKV